MLTWKVKRFDINSQKIVDYDILKYREDLIKRLKKIYNNREEFSERLRRQMMCYYWSKAEHELILKIINGCVILAPWCGCREPEKVCLDVSIDLSFDWYGFAEYHINRQYTEEAKIDIYDQLAWNWDEFVDYCWYTKLPYERKHEKFNE